MLCRVSDSLSPRWKRHAFALIELVMVLVIGAILLGLVVPALHSAQLGAGRREADMKLRAHCLAMLTVNDVYKKLPPAFDKFGPVTFPASAHVHIMPYMESDNLYKKLLQNNGKGEAANLAVSLFLAPDDPGNLTHDLKGIQNFAANLRVLSTKGLRTKHNADMPAPAAIEPGDAVIPRSFPDGLSLTVLVATKFGYCGKGGSRYMAPPNAAHAAFFGQNAAHVTADASTKTATFQLRPSPQDCCTSPLMAQSFYQTMLLAGMCDGSARQVSSRVTPITWNAALQPNDGMPLGGDWND